MLFLVPQNSCGTLQISQFPNLSRTNRNCARRPAPDPYVQPRKPRESARRDGFIGLTVEPGRQRFGAIDAITDIIMRDTIAQGRRKAGIMLPPPLDGR